jgi:hypothetical protein
MPNILAFVCKSEGKDQGLRFNSSNERILNMGKERKESEGSELSDILYTYHQ